MATYRYNSVYAFAVCEIAYIKPSGSDKDDRTFITKRLEYRGSDALYGVSKWGAGYFAIGQNGNLWTPDTARPHMQIDFTAVIEEIERKGYSYL